MFSKIKLFANHNHALDNVHLQTMATTADFRPGTFASPTALVEIAVSCR